MESLRKANQRLKNYPLVLGKCATSASVYAKCVTADFDVKQGACEKEFAEFRECLKRAAKDMKINL